MNYRNLRRKARALFVTFILIISGLICIISTDQLSYSTEAISFRRQGSYNDFINGTLSNISISGVGNDSELKLTRNLNISWFNQTPPIQPTPRFAHNLAFIHGTNRILLFGGKNESSVFFNDTWIYDLGNNSWTQKFTSSAPEPRDRFGLAPIWGTYKVVLFGGGDDGQYFNDTWVYDLSQNEWTQMNPSVSPETRFAFGMTFVAGDDRVILFGGGAGTWPNPIRVQDTWIYDLGEDRWIKKNPLSKPTPRAEHAMAAIYNDDKIVLFGGYDGISKLDDTWVYDISNDTWTRQLPTTRPNGRYRHAMTAFYGENQVLLYGGNPSVTPTKNETWIYNVDTNEWIQYFLSTNPGDSQCHDLAAVYGTNKIIDFGGYYSPDGFTYFSNNHTWVAEFIKFYNTSGTFISTPMDISNRSTIKTISWNSDTPSNTEIKFQLRSADDLINLDTKEFRGPDGTIDTFYSTSGGNIWLGHINERWLQYKAYLSTTDYLVTPSLFNITITYNQWPNTTLLTPINNTIISDDTPIFYWNFTDFDSTHQTAFQLIISDDVSFNNIRFNSNEQDSINERWQFPSGTSYSRLPDGEWFWKVRTKDNDDDWSVYSEPLKVIIDTTAPITNITVPMNNSFYHSLDRISGIAYESSIEAGIKRIEIQIKRLDNNEFWNGTFWTLTESWLSAEGDTNWEFDSSEIDWTSGVRYSVQARAIDNLNNIELPTGWVFFGFDFEPPISKINVPGNNTWLNKLDEISGSATDINGSGVNKVEIYIKTADKREYWDGNVWIDSETWLLVDGNENWSYDATDIKWVTDTNYIIRPRSIDNINNTEVLKFGTYFMYDDKPPENLSISINHGAVNTTTTNVSLTLIATDSGSGVAEMAFSLDEETWTPWIPYIENTFILLPDGFGEKTVYYKVKDRAGNIVESIFASINYVLDTDNDTIPDDIDDFPTDPAASVDSDGDEFPDAWNPGQSKENSTTGLILDVFPENPDEWEDFDEDGFGDNRDAFPDDPAASLDSDGDKYPDKWNPGKSKKDSTTGLSLDEYPNDPDWHSKKPFWYEHPLQFLLLIIIITFLLTLAILFIIIKRRKERIGEPFASDRILREVRDAVIYVDDESELEVFEDELKEKVSAQIKESYARGILSEDTYEYINNILEDEEL